MKVVLRDTSQIINVSMQKIALLEHSQIQPPFNVKGALSLALNAVLLQPTVLPAKPTIYS